MYENILSDFGLNAYEARVYETLCHLGTSKASELTEFSGVPRTRLYDTLDSLIQKTWVVLEEKNPRVYRAINPKKKVTQVLKVKRKQLENEADQLLASLELPYNSSHKKLESYPAPLVGFISKKHAYKQIQEMIEQAKTRVIFHSLPVTFITEFLSKHKMRKDIAYMMCLRSDETLPKKYKKKNVIINNISISKEFTGGYFSTDGKEALVILFVKDKTIGYRLSYPRCRVCISESLERDMERRVFL